MAARIKVHHQDDVRKKIQAIKLVQLLQEHANGERTMEATQIQAAKILLDKSISNAPTVTEVSGPDGSAIPVGLNVTFR